MKEIALEILSRLSPGYIVLLILGIVFINAIVTTINKTIGIVACIGFIVVMLYYGNVHYGFNIVDYVTTGIASKSVAS